MYPQKQNTYSQDQDQYLWNGTKHNKIGTTHGVSTLKSKSGSDKTKRRKPQDSIHSKLPISNLNSWNHQET